MSDAALALIGALAGGSVLKIIEYWLNRGKSQVDQQAQYRDELRKDIDTLRKELSETQTELDSYREKYFALRAETAAEAAKLVEDIVQKLKINGS